MAIYVSLCLSLYMCVRVVRSLESLLGTYLYLYTLSLYSTDMLVVCAHALHTLLVSVHYAPTYVSMLSRCESHCKGEMI